MNIYTKYEPIVYADGTVSKFDSPVAYVVNDGKEIKVVDFIKSLLNSKLIDLDIYNKLIDKRTSLQTIAATIKEFIK